MAETYHPRGQLVDGYKVRQHPSYMVWADMKSRCNDPDHPDYGGRGIYYCEAWKHFANFARDMGLPPFAGASIERKDNEKGYSPDNCVWADRHQQARNRRRFKNNTSGFKGVVPVKSGFNARYDDHGQRINLGNYDTAEEAAAVREQYIATGCVPHNVGHRRPERNERRLRRDSSTGRKGITRHTKGGFLVRKTVNGDRKYLGFAPTMERAIEIWEAAL